MVSAETDFPRLNSFWKITRSDIHYSKVTADCFDTLIGVFSDNASRGHGGANKDETEFRRSLHDD
jgi:hypothetical protein